MKAVKISNDNGNGFTRIIRQENIEQVNPVDYYKDLELKSRAIQLRDIISMQAPFMLPFLRHEFFLKEAADSLDGFFEKYEKTEIPPNFIELLKADKKKDQERLLKGQSLNIDQFMALVFTSYDVFGYLYSKYFFENLAKGTKESELPKLAELKEDGAVRKVGKTDLTDGELKNVINHRKVIIAHFFEQGDIWHCFFITHNSIGGRENWRNGQPHFHYISNAFGISKDDFVKSMESGDYKSTSIHIPLLGYGYQPS